MIRADTSDLDRLAADLERTPGEVAKDIRQVVSKGALNIKRDWQARLSESPSFKGVAGSVSYDLRATVGGVEAEIGPDLERYPGLPGRPKQRPAAGLAHIAHFGGARGGGGTVPDPQDYADREAPRFEGALAALVEKAVQ